MKSCEGIGCFGKVLAVFVIITSICLAIYGFISNPQLLTAQYIVAMVYLFDNTDYDGDGRQGDPLPSHCLQHSYEIVNLAFWILSILVLLIAAFCGIFGVCKPHERCLCSFGVIVTIMALIAFVQLVLTYVTFVYCRNYRPTTELNDTSASICSHLQFFPGAGSTCNPMVDDLIYYVPLMVLCCVATTATFSAFGFRHFVKEADTGSASGQYFG